MQTKYFQGDALTPLGKNNEIASLNVKISEGKKMLKSSLSSLPKIY
jgi:hypothetical protein